MSIYVKVGDEVLMIAGPGGPEFGRAASSPVPAEVVELEIAKARARGALVDQEVERPAELVGSVTLTQVAGSFVERRPTRRVVAALWTGTNWPDVEAWLEDRVESAKLDPDDATVVVVWDDDARIRCGAGNWLVQDGSGEVCVLAAERFEKLYASAPLDDVATAGAAWAEAWNVCALKAAGSEEITYARVTGEVFAPTMFRATLSAPTLDEFKALFCSYASKIGLVSHDVGLPALEGLKASEP